MMNPLDLFRSRMLPTTYRGLEALGDLEWVRMGEGPDPEHYSAHLAPSDPRIDRLARVNSDVNGVLQFCKSLLHLEGAALTWTELYSMSQIIHSGPKVIVPTVEQCFLMKDVELSVRLERYRQPFRPVLIQYPQEWVKWLKAETGSTILYTMINYQPNLMSIHIHNATDEDLGSVAYLVGSFTADPKRPLEELLKITDKKDFDDSRLLPEEKTLGQICRRVALNVILLATNYGVSDPIPYNADHYHDMVKRRKKRPDIYDKQLKNYPFYYQIKQTVDLTKTRRPGAPYQGGTHASPGPHWRSGHWHTYLYGPGKTMEKERFVEDIMVNRHKFVGSGHDTSVIVTDNIG